MPKVLAVGVDEVQLVVGIHAFQDLVDQREFECPDAVHHAVAVRQVASQKHMDKRLHVPLENQSE